MNNKLVSKENITQTPPQWQHPVLPGNMLQGSLLFSVNDSVLPPQDPDNFKWLRMEDVIGTADVKLVYNEELNEHILYKAKGHLYNDNKWRYDYEEVGKWYNISEATQEALLNLIYVSYEYDTTVSNALKVYGIKKDGAKVLLCDIVFASMQDLQEAVQNLYNNIQSEQNRAIGRENEIEAQVVAERNRATLREDEIEDLIEAYKVYNGIATDVDQTQEGRSVSVRVDNDSIIVDNDNKLKANVIDDTRPSNDKGYSSAKITQLLSAVYKFVGEVDTFNDLPDTANFGDVYKVLENNNKYWWDGTGWDDFEEDYIAGVGIDISNRVISATGIAFRTGEGVKVEGSGTNATLSVNKGTGLKFETDGKLSAQVQNSKGLYVDANGIGCKLDDDTMEFTNDGKLSAKAKVAAGDGIELYVDTDGTKVVSADVDGITVQIDNTTNKIKSTTNIAGDGIDIIKSGAGLLNNTIKVNANFDTTTTALGAGSSNITLFADGKIGIPIKNGDFIELASITPTTAQRDIALNDTLDNYSLLLIEIGDPYDARGLFLVSKNVGAAYTFSCDIISGISGEATPQFWYKTHTGATILSKTVVRQSGSGWWKVSGTTQPINTPIGIRKIYGVKL